MTAVHHGSNCFVFDEVASIGGQKALVNFRDQPLVVTHQALNSFGDQRCAVAALLFGEACQLRLQCG